MKIAILTYNIKHKKTYDTLMLLKARGFNDVTVFAQKMTYCKKRHPLIIHRPQLLYSIPDLRELCLNIGYKYIEGSFLDTISLDYKDYIFLLCGAGLLPDEIIHEYKIINSHPGYIPQSRGLDSYKWSLYYGDYIGVTTHFIGDYVDAGEIIERRIIDVTCFDSFHSIAQKVYDVEIDMLVNSIFLLDKTHMYIIPENGNQIYKRMPEEIERELAKRFHLGEGFEKYI